MSTERRQYKRFKPNFTMKAIMIPYLEIAGSRHQLDPVEGAVLDYSDGGVKVLIHNHSGRDLTKAIWMNQELYIILQLSTKDYYTLKGKTVRFTGHPRDDQFDVAIMFIEEPDLASVLPVQNIELIREKLRALEADSEEVN